MVGGRRDRRLNGGGNVSGAMMWLYVGEIEDIMLDAMYRESGCGRRDRGLYVGCNV